MINNDNINHIAEAVRRGKLSHAYIINGTVNSGKEEFADFLAMTLLCDKAKENRWKTFAPCGSCPACVKTKSLNHPDIIHVTHEKSTVLSVREIREQVVEDISIKPYYGPYKIYIIKDAELMNEPAQNALLKTIEEPPEYGLILLLTDNADGFLNTIRSRCIRLNMELPDKEKTVEFLLDEDGRRVLEVLEKLSKMDALEINSASKEFEGFEKQKVFDITRLWLRDVLVLKSTGNERNLYFAEHNKALKDAESKISFEGVNKALEGIIEAETRIKAAVKAEAAFENLLFTIRGEMKQ